jgi:hypothetical protein
VFPRVNILHTFDSREKIPFSYLNRKEVQLNGYLLRGSTIPNEKLSLYINLKNPKQSIIKRIEAVLIQHHQIAQSHHEEIIFRINLPELHEFNGTKFERTFDLVIPSLDLAPSYEFMAQFNRRAHPVVTRYELELKVKAHGVFTDFEVKLPVIIGTELRPDQQETNNSAEMTITNTSISDYDEPPPSYESVISNKAI